MKKNEATVRKTVAAIRNSWPSDRTIQKLCDLCDELVTEREELLLYLRSIANGISPYLNNAECCLDMYAEVKRQ